MAWSACFFTLTGLSHILHGSVFIGYQYSSVIIVSSNSPIAANSPILTIISRSIPPASWPCSDHENKLDAFASSFGLPVEVQKELKVHCPAAEHYSCRPHSRVCSYCAARYPAWRSRHLQIVFNSDIVFIENRTGFMTG
jgi:hypothetical protein